MEIKPIVWSYSSIKDFENCPRKYHEMRVLKKFKQSNTDATLYGTAVHLAFEEFIRDGTPLPARFAHFQPYVDPLKDMEGDKYCEYKMGIRADFSPCEFFAPDVWWRGIPDLLVINDGVARVVDYKTGKSSRYADTGQLELLSAAIMQTFPEVHTVKGALLFVVARDVVKAKFTRADLPKIWSKWVGEVGKIEAALENGMWNEKEGPLCRYCPVSTCVHNRG